VRRGLRPLVELPRHFKRFEAEISLNPARERRINAAVRRAQGIVDNDGPLEAALVAPTLVQGSFALGTVVRPLGGRTRYDVDIVLPMDFDQLPKRKPRPSYVINYVHRRLSPHFGTLVRRKSKCIRVDYPDDFHIDFVPAHALETPTGPFEICDSDADDFIETDPQALIDWVEGIDLETDNRFVPGLKMLKRWRDQKFGMDRGPTSHLLTVLAGRSWEAAQYEREAPIDFISDESPSVDAFALDLADAMLWHLEEGNRLEVPGAFPIDLGRHWAKDERALFRSKLATFVDRGSLAWNTDSTPRAIEAWNQAFGPTFRKFAPRVIYG
jgi:hypothetical protein